MFRFLTIFILLTSTLHAEEFNPSTYTLVGVINEVGRIENSVAMIKDNVSSKTHALKVGDALPPFQNLYVLSISSKEVSLGDGSKKYQVGTNSWKENEAETDVATSKDYDDEIHSDADDEEYETVEDALEALSGALNLPRKDALNH